MASNFKNPVSLVLLTFLCLSWWCSVLSVPFTEFVYPNFSTSFLQYIDRSGGFLHSRNGTFVAAMCCPGNQQIRSYLCVLHSVSNTVIWSANRDSPVSSSGKMNFTNTGSRITETDGSQKWSTPVFQSPVFALRLTEQGNLVIIDESNRTLWQSFDYPTDTIVTGQTGVFSLRGSISVDDLGSGDYKLSLIGSDAILQWKGQTYWKLSMETKAFTDSTSYFADSIIVNDTGLYLLNGSTGVIQVNMARPSAFRVVKLDYTGQLSVKSLVGVAKSENEFVGPGDSCRIPYICGKVGLCTEGVSATMPLCSCVSNFKQGTQNSNISSCVPIDASFSLPGSCNSSTDSNSSYVSYTRLGYGVNYFSNAFSNPTKYGVKLSDCQSLCTKDCNCYGLYFVDSSGSGSGSCSLVENSLGSFMLAKDGKDDGIGYIKSLVRIQHNHGGRSRVSRPGLVILPLVGVFLLFVMGYILWRRSRSLSKSRKKVKSFRSISNSSSDEEEAFSIQGLPVRYQYSELERATENFKTEIGSGGFGCVYKGVLPDKCIVAVKKLNNIGKQGKKDFCAEIAVIGNIHHVNLVKLKGYCAQGKHRLLVYEYMNRSSLDRSLFRGDGLEPVLEWKERAEIAIGAARGLAYLHCGCEHKIIHCDIKPENILLHDRLQAKLSDFGLSKLLSPEQSSHFTTMRGTRGYLAPEWLTSSEISEKTDVYSFGMMLLEIVSGRKNCPSRQSPNLVNKSSGSTGDGSSSSMSNSSTSQYKLVYFPLHALEMHEQKRYKELADSRLEGRVSSEEVEKFICVGLCCVHEEPSLRPNMVDVIGMLDGSIPFCRPKIGSLNFLRFYGLRFSEPSNIQGTQRQQNDSLMHPLAESPAALTSGDDSYPRLSYISSHQVSGPR